MDKFNRLFQKSTQDAICQLYTEMSRLVSLYASNVLKPESITAVAEELSKLSFASAIQLTDENLEFGDSTWAALSAMEDEFDTKPFYQAVWDFYVEKIAEKISIWGHRFEGFRNHKP